VKFTSSALLVVENPITPRAGRLDIWTHTHSPGPITYTAMIHVFFLVLEYICLTCLTWDSLAFLSSFFVLLFVTGLSEVGLAMEMCFNGWLPMCSSTNVIFMNTLKINCTSKKIIYAVVECFIL
jgi:hypothetical protein